MPGQRQPQSESEAQHPSGVDEWKTLTGPKKTITQIAWSPDGTLLASGTYGRRIYLWDVEGQEGHKHILIGHAGPVHALAWSPDGLRIASGAEDARVCIWDVEKGEKVAILREHHRSVYGLAWHGKLSLLASAGRDRTILLWNTDDWSVTRELKGHASYIACLAWSPDGQILASGSYDQTIRLWDAKTGDLLQSPLLGHSAPIFSLAWSPDGKVLASGSSDDTIGLWDPRRGCQTNSLEGHTDWINSVTFSRDGRLLASKSNREGNAVRLWSCESWNTVGEIVERGSDKRSSSIAFHPRIPRLATLGRNDKTVRLWDLSVETLLASIPKDVRRSAAKIVLVGESGVGKTSLGWRLAYDEFKDQGADSTHGQQFWYLDTARFQREDQVDCEAVLWDLAGQPDYRLIHTLFLEDVDLAILVFDAANRLDPLRDLDYWLDTLRRCKGSACRTILVGARVDRGVPSFADGELNDFCRERGITGGYLSTSAFTGEGMELLRRRIQEELEQSQIMATSMPPMFKDIKDYILKLKEKSSKSNLLCDPRQLSQDLQQLRADWTFSWDAMMTAVKSLAKHGYIHLLRTASGKQRILLSPELLNNIAASMILEARRDYHGLGALDEKRLLMGGYTIPELDGLKIREREILLDSATVLFLKSHVCFRELGPGTTFLIFPTLINVKKPVSEDRERFEDDISYSFKNVPENLFATLVVRIGYTNIFTLKGQWQHDAQFVGQGKGVFGFRREEAEEEISFVLYFSKDAGSNARGTFRFVFRQFLENRGVEFSWYPPLECRDPDCGVRLLRQTVADAIKCGRPRVHCHACGQALVLDTMGDDNGMTIKQKKEVAQQEEAANQRTRFEVALRRLGSYLRPLNKSKRSPSCFISYAWEVRSQKKWVRSSLAKDLRLAGIDVILDDLENSSVVSRFIERIDEEDKVIVVGTTSYLRGYDQGSVLAAEVNMINKRLLNGPTERQDSVVPILLDGEAESSFPPLIQSLRHFDLRKENDYYSGLFDVVLTLFDVSFKLQAVSDLRDSLRTDVDE